MSSRGEAFYAAAIVLGGIGELDTTLVGMELDGLEQGYILEITLFHFIPSTSESSAFIFYASWS